MSEKNEPLAPTPGSKSGMGKSSAKNEQLPARLGADADPAAASAQSIPESKTATPGASQKSTGSTPATMPKANQSEGGKGLDPDQGGGSKQGSGQSGSGGGFGFDADAPPIMPKAASEDTARSSSTSTSKTTKKIAGTAAAGAAGAQAALPMLLMMQLLSMLQAAFATALSWVSGVAAFLQGLAPLALAALSTTGVGVIIVAVIAVNSVFSQQVDDTGYYCGNSIDVTSAANAAEDASDDATMTQHAQQVWAVMKGWGMSDENIAGILGNWEAESNIDPEAVQGWVDKSQATDTSKGIGMGQWTGSRNSALRKYASDNGMEWYTVEAQLSFMIAGDDQMYITAIKKMVKTSMGTPSDASAYFRAEWERNKAGTASDPDRAKRAEKWFGRMAGWSTPSQYLNDALSSLAQTGSNILGFAGDVVNSVANTLLGWLGMTCPSAVTGEDGSIPTWNGEVPPAFAGEPGGQTKPIAIRAARVAHMYFADYISSYGGYSDRGSECSYSDHCLGYAVDLMVKNWDTDEGNAHGWIIAQFFQKYAKELGVTYIIFNKQKWNSCTDAADLAPEKWRAYQTPRGVHNPTNDHYDHVHVSFEGGLGTCS